MRQDRELLLLPVMSLTLSALVVVGSAAAMVVTTTAAAAGGGASALHLLWLVAASVAAAVSAVFFNGAVVAGAHERLVGGDPTVRSSLRAAGRMWLPLLGWAAMSVALGVILGVVRSRGETVGRWLSLGAGVAWQLVSFLAVPAIVIDELGPVDAVRRSADLLRSSWGENAAANVGFWLVAAIAAAPALLTPFAAASRGTPSGLAVAMVAAGGLWIFAVVVVTSALSGVFQAALYLHASAAASDSSPAAGETFNAAILGSIVVESETSLPAG